jgi:hypothetical protein
MGSKVFDFLYLVQTYVIVAGIKPDRALIICDQARRTDPDCLQSDKLGQQAREFCLAEAAPVWWKEAAQ